MSDSAGEYQFFPCCFLTGNGVENRGRRLYNGNSIAAKGGQPDASLRRSNPNPAGCGCKAVNACTSARSGRGR